MGMLEALNNGVIFYFDLELGWGNIGFTPAKTPLGTTQGKFI